MSSLADSAVNVLETRDRVLVETDDREPMPQWTLTSEDAGIRLDKYLAAPDRAGRMLWAVSGSMTAGCGSSAIFPRSVGSRR